MPATAFADLLVALALPAADALVAALQAPDRPGDGMLRHLRAARCACRALRDLVDTSMLSLVLNVRAGDLARWRAGWQPPSLARWPRANNVTIDFKHAADADALLLAAPVLEGARQRLTQLVLQDDMNHGSGHMRGGEAAVAALAPRLPALRSLTLTGYSMPASLSYDPAQQAAMYGALAALPCLASLTLPDCRSLDCAGALAGSSSLRSLVIDESWFANGFPHPAQSLSRNALRAIASLQHLQRLSLRCYLGCCSAAEDAATCSFVELLSSLSPSVQQFDVGALMDVAWERQEGFEVAVSLSNRGGIQSVNLSEGGSLLDFRHVLTFAEELLRCPKLGPSLGRLDVRPGLCVMHDADVQPLVVQPLLELFGRCERVKLDTLVVHPGVSVGAVQQLLRQLPGVRVLRASLNQPCSCGLTLGIQLRAPNPPPSGSAPGAGGAATTGAASVGGQPSSAPNRDPTPTSADLLQEAMQRWVASSVDRCFFRFSPIVLLRGPAVAALLGSPQDLTAWVRRVAQLTGVEASYKGVDTPRVQSYTAVPPAAAVLLHCESEATASLVAAAAARAVAAAAEAPAPGELRQVALLDGWRAADHLGRWASEVAQEVLEGGHGTATWSEWERVECVLQLWAELGRLPWQVRL